MSLNNIKRSIQWTNTVLRLLFQASLFILLEKTDKIPITVSMHICDGSSYKHTHIHTNTHTNTHLFTHTHFTAFWRGTCLNEFYFWNQEFLNIISLFLLGNLMYMSRWCKHSPWKVSGGWGKTNQRLIGENKLKVIMQKNRWDFSPLCCFFFFWFFSAMVDKFLWSVVLLLLYEAHAQRNASQIPDDFHLYLFSFFGLRIWLEDAGGSLWYKICYSMYVSSPVCVSLTLTCFWMVEETLRQNTHS